MHQNGDGGKAAGSNWASNLEYFAPRFHEVDSVEAAQEIVASSERVRALGTRHCFNRIADCDDVQISIRPMSRVLEINLHELTVAVEGGASYGQVCAELDRAGFALGNLASLPHISIVGAVATATHGSGAHNKNLAAAVSSVEFINGDGDLVTMSREKDGERFDGVPVHLGGLGLVTRISLDIVPTFRIRQHVYVDLPAESMRRNFDRIMEDGYSVSLFTDYRGGTINQVWRKQLEKESRSEPESDFFGALPAATKMHPVGQDPEYCTLQMGEAGPWYDRLPHFRMGFTPSSGEELQSEYFVRREDGVAAYTAIEQLAGKLADLLLISEVRLIDADDLWMSTAYGEPKVGFHFTWRRDPAGVRRVLPQIEDALRPFNAIPHLGKVFTMSPAEVRFKYQRLDDFDELLRTFDPGRKFSNAFLRYYLFGSDESSVADAW